MDAYDTVSGLLCHLDDTVEQFESRLQLIKDQAKQDVQHLLQLSDGWRAALESDHARVLNKLDVRRRSGEAGTLEYDTKEWGNLDKMLQHFRLSPMPLLQAICGLADRMSQAIEQAERNVQLHAQGRWPLHESDMTTASRTEAADAIDAPPGTGVTSFIASLQSVLMQSARLANRIGPQGVMVVMLGLVSRTLVNLRCDPLAFPPSLCQKLGLTATDGSAPADAVIEAFERAVQADFVRHSACSTEMQCILNGIHLFRSVEHAMRVSKRLHRGRGDCLARWGLLMLTYLQQAHQQMCTAEFSPAVTIQLPEARRKANARYRVVSRSPDAANPRTDESAESDATMSCPDANKFAALIKKQEIGAWAKGEQWARQCLPRRQEVWQTMLSRYGTAIAASSTLAASIDIGSLDDVVSAAMSARPTDRALISLKRSRTDRRRSGAPAEYESISVARRKAAQIAIEKATWAWPSTVQLGRQLQHASSVAARTAAAASSQPDAIDHASVDPGASSSDRKRIKFN